MFLEPISASMRPRDALKGLTPDSNTNFLWIKPLELRNPGKNALQVCIFQIISKSSLEGEMRLLELSRKLEEIHHGFVRSPAKMLLFSGLPLLSASMKSE